MISFTIKYRDQKNKESLRRIDLISVGWSANGTRVLNAYCHRKEMIRTFFVDRIITMSDALDNEVFNIDIFFSALYSGKKKIEKVEVIYLDSHSFDIGENFFIDYCDSKGDLTKRSIRADTLIETSDGQLYIQGFCNFRKGPRRFKVERISLMIDSQGEIIANPKTYLVRFKKAA